MEKKKESAPAPSATDLQLRIQDLEDRLRGTEEELAATRQGREHARATLHIVEDQLFRTQVRARKAEGKK